MRRRREDETYRQSVMNWTYESFKRRTADPIEREVRLERNRTHSRKQYEKEEIAARIRFRGWVHSSDTLRFNV